MLQQLTKFAVLLVFLSIAQTARAAEGGWIQDQQGCRIVNPNPQPKETVTWSGACKDGLAEGQGVLQWFEDGAPTARYEGQLQQGWADGKGSLTTPDGTRYAGEWKQSREHGEGRMEWPNGTWYEGEWRDGKPNGFGQYRTPDGKLLTGKFIDGEFEPAPKDDPALSDDPNRT